jgi:hypothetical protein
MALKITNEEKDRWAAFLRQTWQAIESVMQESKQKLTIEIIVECVLDANRMQMYSNITPEEEKVLCEAYYAHGMFKRSPPGFKKWVREILNY